MGWGKDSAGHWEFDQAPMGIWRAQIGLGVFLLFAWGGDTMVGGWIWEEREASVIGMHFMKYLND